MLRRLSFVTLLFLAFGTTQVASADDKEIRIDYATYNPLSLVLKQQGLLEKAFAGDGDAQRQTILAAGLA